FGQLSFYHGWLSIKDIIRWYHNYDHFGKNLKISNPSHLALVALHALAILLEPFLLLFNKNTNFLVLFSMKEQMTIMFLQIIQDPCIKKRPRVRSNLTKEVPLEETISKAKVLGDIAYTMGKPITQFIHATLRMVFHPDIKVGGVQPILHSMRMINSQSNMIQILMRLLNLKGNILLLKNNIQVLWISYNHPI
ncbi:hypothetical protein CR513_10103, partial [Mucuna pruriens]